MVRAFGDMDPSARVRMIRDQFVTGHRDCDLQRHLVSVPPDTPIRDIVDRCRVWESHVDVDDRCHVKPTLAGTRSVCLLSDWVVRLVDRVVAAVTTPVVGLADLETLVQKAWTLPPTGPRDRLWTPDEQTYPPLNREPVDRPVCPPVSCRLTYRSDKPLDGAVKASTSRDELHTNKVIVFGPAGSVAVGVTPSADSAGDVAVDVASPADLAGVITAGVASLVDLAGDATVGVASSAVALSFLLKMLPSVWRPRSLLRWRPQPTLLGWRPRPILLRWRPRLTLLEMQPSVCRLRPTLLMLSLPV